MRRHNEEAIRAEAKKSAERLRLVAQDARQCFKTDWSRYTMLQTFKPRHWFQRSDPDGDTQVACSRECISIVAKKTGKTSVVLPV